MWTDDPDVVESCDFYRSLLNFDSIDSIGAHIDTDAVHGKMIGLQPRDPNCPRDN